MGVRYKMDTKDEKGKCVCCGKECKCGKDCNCSKECKCDCCKK